METITNENVAIEKSTVSGKDVQPTRKEKKVSTFKEVFDDMVQFEKFEKSEIPIYASKVGNEIIIACLGFITVLEDTTKYGSRYDYQGTFDVDIIDESFLESHVNHSEFFKIKKNDRYLDFYRTIYDIHYESLRHRKSLEVV